MKGYRISEESVENEVLKPHFSKETFLRRSFIRCVCSIVGNVSLFAFGPMLIYINVSKMSNTG